MIAADETKELECQSDVITELSFEDSDDEVFVVSRGQQAGEFFPSTIYSSPIEKNDVLFDEPAFRSNETRPKHCHFTPRKVYSSTDELRFPWPIQRGIEHLNVGVFLEQFLVHVFHPLSLPVHFFRRGFYACRNQGLLRCAIGSVIFNHVIPFAVWGSSILYQVYSEELESQGVYSIELVLAWALYLIHRSSIATKYALMYENLYTWFLNEPQISAASKFTYKMQLVSSWMDLSDETIADELENAQIRQGCDTRKVFFKLPHENSCELHRWKILLTNSNTAGQENMHFKEFLRQASAGEQQNNQSSTPVELYVDGFTVLKAIVRESTKRKTQPYATILASVLCVVLSSIPGGSRVVCTHLMWRFEGESLSEEAQRVHDAYCGNGFFGNNAIGYTFTSLTTFATMTLIFPLVSLFLICIFDFNRRKKMLDQFGTLIHIQRPIRFGHQQDIYPERSFPSIDMHDPDEIRAWTLCRLVLHDFGATRLRRCSAYIGLAFLLGIAILVWFLLDFVRLYGDKLALRVNAVVHLSIIYGGLLTGFAVLAFVTGARANIAGEYHSKALLLAKIVMTDFIGQLTIKSQMDGQADPNVTVPSVLKEYETDKAEMSQVQYKEVTASTSIQQQHDTEEVNEQNKFGSLASEENLRTSNMEEETLLVDHLQPLTLDRAKQCVAEVDRGAQLVEVLRKVRPCSLLGIATEVEYATSMVSVAGAAIAFVIQEAFF